jgi:hypothetical protein
VDVGEKFGLHRVVPRSGGELGGGRALGGRSGSANSDSDLSETSGHQARR